MLEFETSIGGTYVNGVDIIRCNAGARIIEFRVMIRPLQAVNLVHRQMAAAAGGVRRRRRSPRPPTRTPVVLGWALALLCVAAMAHVGAAVPAGAAGRPGTGDGGDRSPVDLATPVDLSLGRADPGAVVRSGDARIEVLTPMVLRLEYSPTGHFDDRPTVNIVDRRLPVPSYSTRVSHGWLTVSTRALRLRYRVGSGPFTPQNTTVSFDLGNRVRQVHPTWEWTCPFDQTCQAGAAALGGGAVISHTQPGFESTAGYVGNLLHPGQGATWKVLGVPAGPARLTLRDTDSFGPRLGAAPQTFDLFVNGTPVGRLVAPPTTIVHPWADLTLVTRFPAGDDRVTVRCDPGDTCDTGFDTLTVSPTGGPPPRAAPTEPLGGWVRGFDTFTYGQPVSCPSGATGATCTAALEPLHTDGLLDRSGWRLLDDTLSAQWTAAGWVQPWDPGGDVEDGYLFAYGLHYEAALRALARLTGPAPLLPRDLFGVWYPMTRRTPPPTSRTRSTRASWPTGCRSTRCRWTPTGRHPTTGTGGSGMPSSSPTRGPSCTGRRPGASTWPSTSIRASTTTTRPSRLPSGSPAPPSPPRSAPTVRAGCGTGPHHAKPSPISRCSVRWRTRVCRSGGSTGAATTRRPPCPG